MKKRILTVLLAVCLVFALGTVGALADGESTTTAAEGIDTYNELQAAINSASDNDVITISGSFDIGANTLTFNKEDVGITLDLGGYTISKTQYTAPDNGGKVLQITNGEITIRNGGITSTGLNSSGNGTVSVEGNSNPQDANPKNVTLTIEDDVIINGSSYAGLFISGRSATANVYGSVSGYYYGISGNGTNTSEQNNEGTVVNIYNGASVTHSCTSDGVAIFQPQEGETNIYGGTISGLVGVQVCSGTLNVYGGNITATGVNTLSNYTYTGSGNVMDGAALSIINRSGGYAGEIMVNVTGGTFTSQQGDAVLVYTCDKSCDKIEELNISDGTFDGKTGAVTVQLKNSSTAEPVITGGSYKEDGIADKSVQDYFPDDQALTVDNNGNVVPDTDNSEARIGSTYYDTLAGAIAAAEAGDTVILVDDIEVDLTSLTSTSQGVYDISKNNITIDGGNNTIKAISSETEKGQGHVFLIRSDVTIKNLTIDGNEQIARTGIQAYGASANVDIENVYIHDCYAYGVLVNNGATVNAKQLRTSDNGWGGVNVDTNGASSKFSMSSGTLNETYSVVVEDDNTTATTDVNLSGGTYNNIQIKTDKTDVNISGGSYTDIVGYSDSKGSYTPNSGDASVTGGTFRNNVNEFATVDYVVSGSRGYTYFADFDDAVAYAGVGDSIDCLDNNVDTYRVRLIYEKNVIDTYDVPEDDYITLPNGQYDGKKIDGWKRDDGDVFTAGKSVQITRNTDFTVILRNGQYNIVIDNDIKHGDVSTDVSSADKGATVYIYVDPDIGYVLDDLDVYYGANNRYSVTVSYVRAGVYKFTMPNASVYITATFKYAALPFTDVNRGQWFYDEVYYVYTNGMMEGDSATTFNPDGRMTRAMFWAVLGRIDGATITGNDWAEEARAWAMREGVSDGTNPNDYVTREQMVTMLWRYAGEKNGFASLIRYTDADKISSYAVEAMRWAIGNGIIEGMTSTTLEPQGTATRAQCAAIFMRFDQM